MDDVSVEDAFWKFAARWSRRWIGRALAGSVVGGVLGVTSLSEAGAKKKHKKRKKKKRRKTLVPPPPPTATVRCDAFTGDTPRRRVAQTFLAPLSGTPTRAEVVVTNNPDNFALLFEVRTVDQAGFPSAVVLASGVVTNLPQIQVGDPPRRVATAFTTVVAPLVAGQPYALAMTGSANWSTQVTNTGAGGDPCPGKVFFDDDDSGPFGTDSAYTDMVFALTITG